MRVHQIFFALLALALLQLSRGSAPSVVRLRAQTSLEANERHLQQDASTDCKPKKMLWFTAIAGIGEHLHEYKRNIRAAVMSAREHAPSLLPNLIINVNDVQADKFIRWYKRIGGRVHPWNLSFVQQLHDAVHTHHWHEKHWLTQYGAYSRIDIPLVIERNLVGKLDGADVDLSYVLYTDCDVLFESDVNSCTAPPVPPIIAMGGDFFLPDGIANSGVTFINVTALGEHHARIVAFGDSIRWAGVYDQTLILEYFKERLTLAPKRFNWTPSWGLNPDTVIVHFHGPKPERCLACVVIAYQSSARQQDFAFKHCGCPEIYMQIFRAAMDKDKAEAYVLYVVKFYYYLMSSFKLRAE